MFTFPKTITIQTVNRQEKVHWQAILVHALLEMSFSMIQWSWMQRMRNVSFILHEKSGSIPDSIRWAWLQNPRRRLIFTVTMQRPSWRWWGNIWPDWGLILKYNCLFFRAKPNGCICLLFKWADTAVWLCRAVLCEVPIPAARQLARLW